MLEFSFSALDYVIAAGNHNHGTSEAKLHSRCGGVAAACKRKSFVCRVQVRSKFNNINIYYNPVVFALNQQPPVNELGGLSMPANYYWLVLVTVPPSSGVAKHWHCMPVRRRL